MSSILLVTFESIDKPWFGPLQINTKILFEHNKFFNCKIDFQNMVNIVALMDAQIAINQKQIYDMLNHADDEKIRRYLDILISKKKVILNFPH
jgi:hypothetical protein